jgi:predicted DsbA family dithiol-disulfide isomerase
MRVLEVFADVACPFTHVGVRRLVAAREERGRTAPVLRFRSWPLEVVNDAPLDGTALVKSIEALRAGVAPDLFEGFHPDRFPASTIGALAAEQVAWRQSPEEGERVALDLRSALFEEGLDVGDVDVVASILARHQMPAPRAQDEDAVLADHEEGRRRGVEGSPHFFTPAGDFFCPSLDIRHPGGGLEVGFDAGRFERFVDSVLA